MVRKHVITLLLLMPLPLWVVNHVNATLPTVDPDDLYCIHWDAAHKTQFLDKQEGQTVVGDEADSARFVFYETPAPHDHGLPTGSCGVRVVIYDKSPNGGMTQTGRWENPEAGMTMEIIGGSHHCYFRILGGGDEDDVPYIEANYILDASGNTTAMNLPGSIDRGVWVTRDGQECLWEMLDDQTALVTSAGKTVWSQKDKCEAWRECFSLDKQYAFRLLEDPDKKLIGAIYSVDGKNTWKFAPPFGEVKAHKEIMGFDSKGALILRVDRKIYRVDHLGKAVLTAEWPVYARRHNQRETTGASTDYDVTYSSSVTQSYEFATNVEMVTDHPRPRLEFNIDTFEGRESLDEGKTWHPISLKVGTNEKK